MKRILIMGLPGAGKTTLAAALNAHLFPYSTWLNADKVREQFDDWDFSEAGRIRQASRMRKLASESTDRFVLIDMVAPLVEMRDIVEPDYIVWVDTISEGRYNDTNKLFVPPDNFDFHITEQDAVKWSRIIAEKIISETKIN